MSSTAESTLTSIRKENSELRKTLAKMDAILGSLPSIFALIQGGKVKEITRRGLETLGYSIEEIQGMDFTNLVHSNHRSLFKDGNEWNFGGKSNPEPQEIELLTKGGEAVSYDLTLHKTAFQGRAAFLAEIAPAGLRRERERNLIRSHKDDLIASMSSGLARKLTPSVRALKDFVARMKARPHLPGGPTAPDPELVTAANELASLTRCLETLSREESERSRVLPFDLSKVVQDAVSHIEGGLNNAARREAPINLQCYLRQASPVEGDPEEIKGAVVWLITDVMEAMPEGGDLYITSEENAGYACVYIQDSGTGVPEESLPKITDPFITTKASDGLGLCMARAVLKRHHGDLHLESSKGGGTTITLRMPLSRAGARERKPGAKKRKNTWILIMEEDHLIRELFFQVLSGKGYHVETAEAFSEGFERLKSRAFDLVIAGTVTGDSPALIRRIRKAAPHTCLALIGDLGKEDLPRRVPHGSVDLVIGKPIDMSGTLNRIAQLLIGRAR